MKCVKCGAALNELRCSFCGFDITSNELHFARKLSNEEILRLTEFIQSANAKGIYEGEYKNGKRHGFGKCTYPNSTVYIGEWKDGKRNGYGKETLSGGEVYKGEFKDDMRHGRGKFTFANGESYEGEFKDDKWHGKGTLTFANGVVFEAEWKDGELIGKMPNFGKSKDVSSGSSSKPSEKKKRLSPIEMLLDQDNNENIVLYDSQNNPIEFQQIAIIPINDVLHAILRPLNLPGVDEEEALVFEITTEDGEDTLAVVDDTTRIDAVFKEYYKLLENEKHDV